MSKVVESIVVTRQETVVLQGAEPIVAEHVHVAIRMKYNEPKFNQQNRSIVNGVPKDWSKRIHNVNKVPRPNSPRCTYCHQIRHQIIECPFIENNVRQGFVKHFQNLNLKLARIGNHGHI
jgi:sulfatase maturation enzyme AslB (radical SAM superfamily)